MKKNRKLRVGVIGVGGRGGLALLAHSLDESAGITAGADISNAALEDFSRKLNGKAALFKDYRKMLDKEEFDAVFVTSPDYCHEEQASAVLRRGIPLYLEKPMALTIGGCDRILAAARKSGAKLFLGHNMRYMRFVRKMKEVIDSGAIGEVRAVWCRHFISYGGDAYFRDWHSERKNTTGLLLQKGAHDIDVIHLLAGSYAKKVSGFGSLSIYNKCKMRKKTDPPDASFNSKHWPPLEQKGFSPRIDVEDHNMILMELENGVQASYMQCFFTPDSCRNYTVIGTEGRIENYGDYGDKCTVEVWNRRTDSFRLKGDVSYEFGKDFGGHGGADEAIVRGFLDYVRDGKKPLTSPVAARYSVAAGCMGTKSIRSGGTPFTVPKLKPEIERYFRP